MTSSTNRTLADNPSPLDYLGFQELVAPIVESVDCTTEPITVGIYGSWGSGKSTVLGLVVSELEGRDDVLVVSLNPWEFDDSGDVKGALIGSVLGALEARFGDEAGVKDKVLGLLKRVSWSRATSALVRGALTMQWDMEKLVDAFTPVEAEAPKSMAGFKEAFGELVNSLPGLTRVVVAVDDLDRCLPAAVMGTLETIKLFLSVDKMAFVLAADHQMVTDAVAASLSETHRNTGFANLYLDKIVQVPVQVPRLSEHDAEAYAGILLAEVGGCTTDDLSAMAAHACTRRNGQLTPLLDDLPSSLELAEGSRRLAAQIARGLSADQRGTPRAVKRFINSLHIRQRLSSARGVELDAEVVTKLFLLEHRFAPMFRALAEESTAGRKDLLVSWETWARSVSDTDAPDGVAAESRALFEDDPDLSGRDLDAYFTFAATLDRIATPTGASSSITDLVRGALNNSDSVARTALDKIAALSTTELGQVVETLAVEARRNNNPERAILQLIKVGDLPTADTAAVVATVKSLPNRLKPNHVAALAQASASDLRALCAWIAASPDALESTKSIAQNHAASLG